MPGTKIEFLLSVTTDQGSTTGLFTQNTGTPVSTTIFAQNFNGVAPGSLPAGWVTIHAGGNNTVPWTTNNTFCGTASNALFHVNANDGLSGNAARFERVASPSITIPTNAEYVTLDFDICYDTEDDPSFNVLAYDGALLRITDFTPEDSPAPIWSKRLPKSSGPAASSITRSTIRGVAARRTSKTCRCGPVTQAGSSTSP